MPGCTTPRTRRRRKIAVWLFRGHYTSGTVKATTTYTDDTFNRVTDVAYTDTYNTASPTPAEHFDSDTATGAAFTIASPTNLVGRVVDAYTKSGSTYIAARAFTYDPAGRATNTAECTIDDCASSWYYNLVYSFDVNSNPLSLHLLTAGTTDFTLTSFYDPEGQLTTLGSSWSDATHPATLLSNAQYGPLGGLASATLGSGETESFAYDQRDRLGCGTIVKGSTTIYSVSLSNANTQCTGYTGSGYSGSGNVVAPHDSVNGNWTYQYDDFNRISSATASSGPFSGTAMSWSYDRYGNRWTQAQTGVGTQTLSYTGHNNRIDGYSYDAAGNVLVANGNQYLYDDENRIVSVTLYSGGTATYSYDAEGQRIRKAVGSTVDEYVYDTDGHQIGDMQPNGAMKRIELYTGGRHLATYDIASNNTYFIHGDWQGTERARTTSSGVSYETCSNLPFGDGQHCTGAADISPMHFTGKPRDTETNLDYFGARYFNSSMARWMSPDWAAKPTTVPYAEFGDPQSLNLYGYVTNNPVSRQDGDGHTMTIYQLYSSGSGAQEMSSAMVALSGDAAQQDMDAALQNAKKSSSPAKPAQPAQQQQFTDFASHLRLDVSSDTAQAGMRDVVYSVEYLSDNGNLQKLDNKIGAQFPKLDVTENNSAKCTGCSGPDASGKYHSTDKSGNRFEDLVSPQPATNRAQSFTVTPHGGGPSAPISVRLAGKDYGTIGQWSDGYHIPYINGYSYQQGLPGGYAPSQ